MIVAYRLISLEWSYDVREASNRGEVRHVLQMFARIKRSVDRSNAPSQTNLCDDQTINTKIKYCMEWERRDKRLAKAFHKCAESYKKDKCREQMAKNVDAIIKNSNGPMNTAAHALHEHLTAKKDGNNTKAEPCQRLCYLTEKGIFENFDNRFKAFDCKELKEVRDACQLLRRKRNNKEGTARALQRAPTDPKCKEKAQVAAAEYEDQLQITSKLLNKIPDYDKIHQDIFEQGLRYFATTF
ncbi:hypothetical protein GCK32_000281 [Trichostrongylus colubriformis]|uniref:Uncharacterized protein n=1 Tax=Trichostrongylus colubriformis TaxID=6319 RepID=A0AAN8IER7_TRICO